MAMAAARAGAPWICRFITLALGMVFQVHCDAAPEPCRSSCPAMIQRKIWRRADSKRNSWLFSYFTIAKFW